MENITLSELAKAKENQEVVTLQQKSDEIIETERFQFTPEEKQRIEEIRKSINFTDSQAVIQYGVGAQRALADFSDSVLNHVRNKDTGQAGNLLADLVVQVKSLDVTKSEGSGLLGKIPFLKEAKNSIEKLKERYAKVEVQIDRIEGELEKARMVMLKDIGMFDTMYQKNLEYFRELQLYIAAGEEEMVKMRNETIPSLREEAARSGDPMDAQLVNDFEDTVNRFEKKIHDLKLSRTIAIQSAPQIKLIQNNDKLLVDRIQTAIVNTIPVWKSQIVIALGLYRQEKTLKLQQEVMNTTNELLKKNSEMLKNTTIDTAKISEKGIVEIETLRKVNGDLIQTIEETLKIQQEGRIRRQNAEQELLKLEDELKNKLMETR